MRRALWIIVIALAIAVDGFFALVNFYPVAPPRDPGPRVKVLVALEQSQVRWLTETLVAEFNREHDSNVVLESTSDEALLGTLQKDQTALLAVLPRALGPVAIASGAVQSFADAVDATQLDSDMAELAPQVVDAAKVDGKQYFVPRAALLDVMVYRVSRVRDAVRHWSLVRREIDEALRSINGKGLPPGYSLELAPEAWDSYDRFVVAYYWARRRYDHKPARPRVGHRTGEALDQVSEIIAGVYRAGATDAAVERFDSDAVRDYLGWEIMYRSLGLFSDIMFGPHPLDDDGVIRGLQSGDLYLATVNQQQAFLLHGGAHRGGKPQVSDPDDLAFAPMPRVSSQALQSDGQPLRRGRPFSFREDWVWMLPKKSPSTKLAYELVQFLWQRDQHVRECEALGTLPLRRDVLRERAAIFKVVWMDDLFDAVFDEWKTASPLPERIEGGLGSTYAQLWDRIVGQRGSLDLLKHPPAPRALEHRADPAPTDADATGGGVPDGAVSTDDDDELADAEDELWRGKVELDPPKPSRQP